MRKTVVIDCLPESVHHYRTGWAIVAVDVIRATTTAVTAAALGWRCFPMPTLDAALARARELDDPLLAGESGGDLPANFEMDNSPAEVADRADTHRPMILLSSSGTRVIHNAADCEAVYLGCFRNYSALALHLAARHSHIAVIGAGSLGQFREEDQICCAWIADAIMRHGHLAGSQATVDVVNRWKDASPLACLESRSVDFLKRTGRHRDLDFVLSHIDDLGVFGVHNGEVVQQ